ncbi:MAG: hypothetical protein KDA96_01520 [Planctomycetaceae bacterium]|nr:hypothetical protein [Planctomycetaceae bacterium]
MRFLRVFSLVALCVTTTTGYGQLPQTRLSSLFPPGAQHGTTTEVVVAGGTDLDELDQLVFSNPGITAVPKFDAAGRQVTNTFVVSVDTAVPPGVYDARVRGLFGISNPVIFRIDSLPEANETAANETVEQAQAVPHNSVFNARCNGATDVDYFKVHADAGQTIVVRAEAALLTSPVQPHLQLLDQAGHRLAEARRNMGRDAVLVHTSTEAADYIIRVQDIVYAGGADYIYRLVVDSRPVVDQVIPQVVSPDGSTPVTVIGRNLPDATEIDASIDGVRLQNRQYLIEPRHRSGSTVGATTSAINDNTFWWHGIDGNLIRMGESSLTALEEARDQAENEADQMVPVPVEVTGAFTRENDEDAFRFSAAKGQSWIIDISSARFGSLADPILIVEQVQIDASGNESFKRLASEDDGRQNPGGANLPTWSDDPSFRLDVPEDGTYRIRMRDRYSESRGDVRLSYHISVRAPVPDFSLVLFDAFPSADGKAPASTGAISLRKGGSYELAVYAWRLDGHNDPITVTAENLPAGVTCSPTMIGAGQNSATLVLTASDDASETATPVRLTATSGTGETARNHSVQVATLANDFVNGLPRAGRLSDHLVVGVMKDEQPFSIQLGEVTYNASQDQQMLIPVTIRRRAGFAGKVDLSFVGMPGNVDAPNFAIEPNADSAVARVFFKENAAVSATTVMLAGTSQVPYRRNPWAAERAAVRVKDAEAQVAAAAESMKAAEAAVTETEKMVTDLTAQVAALTEQVAAAEAQQKQNREASVKLVAEFEAAAGKLNEARATLAKTATPGARSADETAALIQTLQTTADSVEQLARGVAGLSEQEKKLAAAVSEAAKLQKMKAEEKVAAEKRLEEQRQAVEKSKAAVADAKKLVDQRNAEKKVADDEAKKTDEAAKPKNVNVRTISNAWPLVVHAAPAKITAQVPDGGAIKKGATAAVAVTVARKNNFAGPVKVHLLVPEGVAGVTSDTVEIAADQTTGTVMVSAAADATVGDVANAVIRATGLVNETELSVDVPVAVKIVE